MPSWLRIPCVLGMLLVAGCATQPPARATFTQVPTPILTPSPGPSIPPAPTEPPAPTRTSTPETPREPTAGCVDGWTSPEPGSTEHAEGLAILEGHMGVDGPWDVDEMRYFTGPDVPWIIEPHHEVVERWYVRAALVADPAFRGRWLLEKRTETIRGVSAVAPFETGEYRSPEWTAFVGEGPPTARPGLPGLWVGIAYDFVTGENDTGQPGLPDEVVECLAGT